MTRSVVLRVLALVAVLAIGAVILALADSTVVFAIGFMLTAIAAVLLTALFFYEVGMSEERDRASRDGRSPHSRGGR